MRAAALVVAAACSSPAVMSPDAQQRPVEYALSVDLRGTRTDLPEVFIDGVASQLEHATYPDLAAADGFQHAVELHYADHVLASFATSTDTTDCTSHIGGGVTSVTVDLEALDSGELRYLADNVLTTTGGCAGDGSGSAPCYCPSQRCAPRITLLDPLFTRMACVPIGPHAAGEPCTLTNDPDGAYDDCGTNLVCVAGACTAFCSTGVPVGYPPEVRCQ